MPEPTNSDIFTRADPDAGIARRLQVVAHDVDQPAETGEMQHDGDDGEEDQEDDDRAVSGPICGCWPIALNQSG